MGTPETLNTQLSQAVAFGNPLPQSEAHNTKRALSLVLCLGALLIQGQGSSDEDAGERKKPRLSKEQAAALEARKSKLAAMPGLDPREVDVWFQKRRAWTKSKKTETERERLKQMCENLIEENRMLREAIEMLKALVTAEKGEFSAGGLSGFVRVCPICGREFLVESGTGAM